MAESSSSGSRKSSARKSSGRKSAKKSTSKKSASRKTTARKTTAKKSTSSTRKSAAKKRGQAQTTEFSGKAVAEFRKALSSNLIRPLELVMISRGRIEEALDEVVKRGRMTRDDAGQLGQALFIIGRQQTDDVMKDLEQLLGRGRSRIEQRTESARKQARMAAGAARKAADPLLMQADRARRVAGVGPSFPISGYDELTAAQIIARLDDLTPAELRKVRDYERRRGNRKSVLEAIDQLLNS
jgi:polyhydroxyalkanoate synthesis regulator phasin